MNKRILLMMLMLLGIALPNLAFATASCGTTPSAFATSNCLPANIVNGQAVAEQAGMQQQFTFNAPAYTNILASNVMNVYVYNTIDGVALNCMNDGNVMNPNVEAGLSGNVLNYFCKMDVAIPASASANGIYAFGFASTTTNLYNTPPANVGIAPQLDGGTSVSSNYNAANNCGQVFGFCYAFQGTSLNNTWASWGTVGTTTVANGITLSGSNFDWGYKATTTGGYSGSTGIIEALQYTTGAGGWGAIGQYTGSVVLTGGGAAPPACQVWSISTGTLGSQLGSTASGCGTSAYVITMINIGSSQNMLVNYNLQVSGSASSDVANSNIIIGADTGNGATLFVQWIRARTAPPANVMPTVTYQPLTQASSLSFTITPNPNPYGSTATATTTCTPASDTCQICSGATCSTVVFCTGTGGCTYTVPIAAVGSTTYYANDITRGTNLQITYQITQAAPTISLPSFPTPNSVTYTGATYQITGNIICLYNQCPANLFINNVNANSFTTQTSNTVNGAVGTYVVVANTLGNGNYLSASITNTLVISQASCPVTLPSFPTSSTYSNTPFTITGQISTFNNQIPANLVVNGVVINPSYTTSNSYTNLGGAGTYSASASTAGNGNYLGCTVSNSMTISQANPTATLTVDGVATGGSATVYADSQYPANIASLSNINPPNPLQWNIDYFAQTPSLWQTFYSTTTAASQTFQSPLVSNIIFYLQTNGNQNYTSFNGFLTANVIMKQTNFLFSLEYGNSIYGGNNLIQVTAAPTDYIKINLTKVGSPTPSTIASGNSILQYDLQNWFSVGQYVVNAIDVNLGTSQSATVDILNPIIYACNGYNSIIVNTPYNTVVQNNQVSVENNTVKQINLFDINLNPLSASTLLSMSGYLNYSVTNRQSVATTANSLGTTVGFTSATQWRTNQLLLCQINSNNNRNPVLTGGIFQYETANQVTSYETFANEQLNTSPLTIDNFYSPYQPNSAKFSVFVLKYGLNQIQAKVQIFLISPNGAVSLVDFINAPAVAGTIVSLPENFSYIFNIYSPQDQLLTIVNATPLYCPLGTICNLGLSTTQNLNYSTTFGISSACSYSGAANALTCVVDDPTTLTKKFWLTVNQTNALNTPQVCNNTLATYTGTLTCSGINTASSRYTYALYGSFAGQTFQLRSGGVGNTANAQFGEAGYIGSLFIIVVVSLVGLFDPIFLIIGDLLAFVVINWLGFLTLNIVILAQLIIMGIMYAYRIKF